MLLRGISGVVLGHSRLDGGAAQAQVGKRQSSCSLISQGTDLSHLCKKYIKRVHLSLINMFYPS